MGNHRPTTRSKDERSTSDDNADTTSKIFRKFLSNGEVAEDDVNQLYMIWKPACHGCLVNTKDNPNCFCGLIPPPNGSRKSGLWQETSEIVNSLGPDPSTDLRASSDTPAGLTNLGATCYANSILQCLYTNKSFRAGVFSVEPEVLEREPVLNELARLFALLHSSKMAFVDSAPFFWTLKLDPGVQRDSHEFLTYFFSLLNRCLSQSRISKTRTIVEDLFRGSFSQLIRCSKCGNESEASPKIQDFYELVLNVKGLKNLEESLDDYLSIEELREDNQCYCNACAMRTDATCSIKLQSLPAVLNFHLRRYVFLPNKTTEKISSVFSFPQELNMARRLSVRPQWDLIYDLAAVSIHKGSAATSGHYTAHIKDDNTGEWWEFDDKYVSYLGRQPFGSTSSISGAKIGHDDSALSTKEVDVPVNGNHACAGQMQSSQSNDGANHVKTFSSSDAYILMYVRRHPNIDGEKTAESDEYKMKIGDSVIPQELNSPLPTHLLKHVDISNSVYLASCEQYKSKKELELSCIMKRQQEVRSVLSEAPVLSIEKPYFWISTEWLRQWADSVTPPVIDNSSIQCSHAKVPVSRINYMKRLSVEAWTTLISKYGGGPTLAKDDYCIDCILESSTVRLANIYRDQRSTVKELAEAALAGEPLHHKLYYVAKLWIDNLSDNLAMENQGSLQTRPKPHVLFGCIPITTENFPNFCVIVQSPNRVKAPRYRTFEHGTNLNGLPLLSSIPEGVPRIAAAQSSTNGDSPRQGGPMMSSLARKGEALALSGLLEYTDERDVIAPADILKQIFMIPYSKARVSFAVHRVGRTLILNSWPDSEEGEKLIQSQNCQPKCVDQSLFLKFAMHSVSTNCPPAHDISSSEQFKSSAYADECMSSEGFLGSSRKSKKNEKKHKNREAVMEVSEVEEKPGCPVQESEKHRKVGGDDFLRVLSWQFQNFHMLLGTDLLILSDDESLNASLHLWDVSQEVTSLTWLEAWLDNFMASVPELVICYHEDGIVQHYDRIKTDDIFLEKGISADGTPAFHPHVVQQNGLSVMRFLQENCQDPGLYWLYKSAEDDVIQLFGIYVIPQSDPKKKALAYIEQGKMAMKEKDIKKASTAFDEANAAIRKVKDHTTVIRIKCDLGCALFDLAEFIVSRCESSAGVDITTLTRHRVLAAQNINAAIKIYKEAEAMADEAGPESASLKNEVNKGLADTYLRLGMLLGHIPDNFCETFGLGDMTEPVWTTSTKTNTDEAANFVLKKALAIYVQLGECCREQAAHANYALGCCRRKLYLRILKPDEKKDMLKRFQRNKESVTKLVSYAKKYWQESIDFFKPETNPTMYLTILIDRSNLSLELSRCVRGSQNELLEKALTDLLEGRHVSEKILLQDGATARDRLWKLMESVLRDMLDVANRGGQCVNPRQTPSKSAYVEKLKTLHRTATKAPPLSKLRKLHRSWTA